MPIERAIRECRFAYDTGHRAHANEPTAVYAASFVRWSSSRLSFSNWPFIPRGGMRGRPSHLTNWIDVLSGLQRALVACPVTPGHFHAASTGQCPWCEIEDESGAQLFVALVRPVAGVPIDLASVWARIEQIIDPWRP